MDRSQRLGEEKINKLLFNLSLPSILGMLAVTIYNAADTIFIGQAVGTLGIAGVSVALPLLMSISTFGHAIGLGGASIISRALGSGNKAKASLTLHNLVTIILVINVFIFGIAYSNLTFFLELFGARGEILPYAYNYAVWALPGSFFLNILYVLVNQIRAEGNARFPMMTQALGAALNLIIDPIFIFGFGWGVMGAALATTISQFIGTLLAIWYYTMNPKSVLKINLRELLRLPDKAITRETFALGASSFGRQIASSVMNIILNNALLHYGGAASIAAFGVIFRLSMFIFMPLFGLNQGFMPIAGYNYGAKKIGRVIESMKTTIIWSTAFCILAMIGFFFFSHEMISIFTKDKQLIEIGGKALKIFIIAFPVIGFQIVGSGLYQALGRAKASLFLALARQVLFLIPFALIFPLIWGEMGIWISFPVADIFAAVITFFMVKNLVKKLKQEAEKHDISKAIELDKKPEDFQDVVIGV